jgi:hypothetical protein
MDDHLHAFRRQHPGDLGTDAGAAARDQRTLSGELQIHDDMLQEP